MNKYYLILLVFSILILRCSKNEYTKTVYDSCNCFEANVAKLKFGSNDEINIVYEKCLKKKIEELQKNERVEKKDSTSEIDHLFNLSTAIAIELKSSCTVFAQFSKKIIGVIKEKSVEKRKPNPPVQSRKLVTGIIESINRLDKNNIEFNLTTIENESLTFFYKNIKDSFIDKVVEIEFEEKIVNNETILWCKKISIRK